jgi:hydroxymethylpyrimidine/phosphomethylpyrimidine kinase
VTAQNTQTVKAIAEVPEEVIAHQIDAVFEDIGADAVKIGMLSAATIVETVVDRLEAWGPEERGRRPGHGLEERPHPAQ